jgi:hypothetical protein
MRHAYYVLSVLTVALGCGGSNDGAPADEEVGGSAGVPTVTGGSTAAGGAKATGGSTAAGGAKATGGSTGSGGAKATGGTTGAGGTTGTGGTVNNDGGPHIVGTCSGLGAVDQWEKITPPAVTSGMGALEILVDPIHAGTIYAGTDKQGIHKSTDCGATWAKANTGRNGTVLDSGMQWTMAVDPVEPNILFAGNLYGSDASLFKSTNSGVDWDSVFPPGSEVATTVDYNFFQELSLEPTDHRHIVVTFHANCKGAYAPMCMAESKDSGTTWRLFKGPTQGWGEDSRPFTLGPTSWLFATTMDGVYYTGDSGATWQKVTPGGGRHQIYKATDNNWYMGSWWGMYRTPDGKTWTQLAGSPVGDGLIGDGTRIFTSSPRPRAAGELYYVASESDGTTWTSFTSPNIPDAADYLEYDADHHVLYSSNLASGVWRMVTQ